MKTRRENAARKGLRLLNKRKAAKRAHSPSPPPEPPSTVAPGDRFDRLTAVERADDYVRPGSREERWTFACVCGRAVTWKVSTVHSNLGRLGWCSCPTCYHAAGGWHAIEKGPLPGGNEGGE